jgi:bifunctional UDP-N-acetylglucosamine pyrophosphorylase/glucosamine-1-phosphate N-acetyltransferase
VGYQAREVEAYLKENFSAVKCVHQGKLLGTADAIKCAQSKIKHDDVLILCADAPLISAKTLSSFVGAYLNKNLTCSLITAHIDEPTALGKILRDDAGKVKAIVEQIVLEQNHKKSQTTKDFSEANSGIYAFDKETLYENLKSIPLNPLKKEYFFTDIVEILYNRGYKIGSYLVGDSRQILGINNQRDLARCEKILYERATDKLLDEGIRIIDPATVFIDEGVKVGEGTIIYPFTFIERDVIIGAHCALGPFIHLRPGTRIDADTHLGNFIEVCRSRLGKNVRVKHFSYLGDAQVADNVNIGAGTVTANYDGENKHKTVISKNAFIGSDTVLIAPVVVGKNAVTGAGSVVTRNVKRNSVVVGVPAKPLKKRK